MLEIQSILETGRFNNGRNKRIRKTDSNMLLPIRFEISTSVYVHLSLYKPSQEISRVRTAHMHQLLRLFSFHVEKE